MFDGSFVCPCAASLRAGVRGEVFPSGGTAWGDGKIPRRVGRVLAERRGAEPLWPRTA